MPRRKRPEIPAAKGEGRIATSRALAWRHSKTEPSGNLIRYFSLPKHDLAFTTEGLKIGLRGHDPTAESSILKGVREFFGIEFPVCISPMTYRAQGTKIVHSADGKLYSFSDLAKKIRGDVDLQYSKKSGLVRLVFRDSAYVIVGNNALVKEKG